jgi:hypothetical protein
MAKLRLPSFLPLAIQERSWRASSALLFPDALAPISSGSSESGISACSKLLKLRRVSIESVEMRRARSGSGEASACWASSSASDRGMGIKMSAFAPEDQASSGKVLENGR